MQQFNVIFLSGYELVMSLVFVVVTFMVVTKLMNRFVLSAPTEHFIKTKHKSGCLISASLICAVVFLARGSVEHSTLALQSLMTAHQGISLKVVLIALGYFVVFYFITIFVSFVVFFLFSLAYRALMRDIDFDDQIENHDNFGLSIFLSLVVLGFVLFVDKPLSHVLGSLVFHNYLESL